MASIMSILAGLRKGMWNFCFPENQCAEQKRQWEYIVKKERLEWSAYHATEMGTTSATIAPEPIVVSLTTHGKRIHTVHLAIESILQQSVKPNRIVLYLGAEEFSDVLQLPAILRRQMERGLEVRFVRDQKSYTKLLPALREFPESNIITVDDDLLYPYDMLEGLIKSHCEHPDCICCHASLSITFRSASELNDFSSFSYEVPSFLDSVSPSYLPEGFAGVLYPPHSLDDRVFDEPLFMCLSPTADDLWFKAMSLLKGTPILRLHNPFHLFHELYLIDAVQDMGLKQDNVNRHRNDSQLRSLFDHFDLYRYFS